MQDCKTVLITGGNAGIGLAIATEIARNGAQVVLACRNQSKAAQAKEKILAVSPSADIQIYPLDLASFASIKKLAGLFLADHQKLDVLINNAGCFPMTQKFTEEGFEMQFGANYLGHVLLTHLLLPAMKNVADARIIHLASVMHNLGRIDFNSFRGVKKYSGLAAYCQSKLANLLFSNELARRLPSTITSNAVHPGGVDSDIYKEWYKILYVLMKPFLITADRAAMLVTKMALSDEWRGQTGKFKSAHGPLPVSRAGRDAELGRRLYKESCRLVGVTPL
jgi:NAD(P)-dependent dehydrogenase (short-subunit alcohol dehydrogenase family)